MHLIYHTILYSFQLFSLFVKCNQRSDTVILTFFHLCDHSASCIQTFIRQLNVFK